MRLLRIRDDVVHTREIVADLRSVIADAEVSGNLQESEREIIGNVMDFRDQDVAALMTPRTEITAADVEDGALGAARVLAASGHSSIPIYEDTLDTVIGTISARDVVRLSADERLEGANLQQIVHPAYFVPETKLVSELFEELRRQKIKIAIVLDEYGGTAGLITVGDIVAELVGDIPDEYDEDGPAPLRHLAGGAVEVDAGLHVSEVNEALELDLPEEADYETLGGFVLAELGHFPTRGEAFERGTHRFEVVDANDRRVLKVRVRRLARRPGVVDCPRGRALRHGPDPAPLRLRRVQPRAAGAGARAGPRAPDRQGRLPPEVALLRGARPVRHARAGLERAARPRPAAPVGRAHHRAPPGLARDGRRYRAALTVLELAGAAAREGRPERGLFDLSCAALDGLGVADLPAQAVLVAFELGFLDELGLAPALLSCAACGRQAQRRSGAEPCVVGATARAAHAAAFSAGAGGSPVPRSCARGGARRGETASWARCPWTCSSWPRGWPRPRPARPGACARPWRAATPPAWRARATSWRASSSTTSRRGPRATGACSPPGTATRPLRRTSPDPVRARR